MATEPTPPVDTSVAIPPSVKRASEAADAIHAQFYPPNPDTPPDPPVQKPIAGITDPELQPQPPAAPAAPAPAAPAPAAPAAPVPDSGVHGSFEHRYLAMKGRFEQAQTTIGSMQEQMSELGDELLRTQNELLRERAGVSPAPKPGARAARAAKALSDEDVKTYGTDLIDFVQRAARDAVTPDIEQVSSQVRQTNQKVTQTAVQGLYVELDREVPDWRDVNVNPRFKQWCRLPDVYSGHVRGKLLNAAFQAADAPRVVAFFRGFLQEEQATGQISAPQPQPPAEGVTPPAAPSEPAVSLESLAAPGRAKPASGGSSATSADKPVYTRAQIAEFYGNVRRGLYSGRDDEKNRLEQSIFAAQRDGRVR